MKTICVRKTSYAPIRGQEMGVPKEGFYIAVDARCGLVQVPGRGVGYELSKYGILLGSSKEIVTTEARLRAAESGLPFVVMQSVALLQPAEMGEVFTHLSP